MTYNKQKFNILTDIVRYNMEENSDAIINLYSVEVKKAQRQRSYSYRVGDFQLISLLDSGFFGHVC